MSLVTNTITRYDGSRAVREDLSNTIYNIAPTETPAIANFGRDTAKSTLFEWQTDALAAAANVPVIEGDDMAGVTDVRAPTARVNNFTQINRKIVTASGTIEAVDKAGMKSYLSYELSKASAEMKRDMEVAVTGIQIGAVGSNSVARKTAGLGAFIVTNCLVGATGTVPTYSAANLNGSPSAPLTGGTPRAFTEVLFKAAQEAVWQQGGDPKMALMNSAQKKVFSTFPGIATRYRDVPSGKQAEIIAAADTFVGDFGETSAVPDRFMPTDIVYVGDPEYVSLAWLRPMSTEQLARTMDGQKRAIIGEWGLRVKSQASWATIAGLT